MSLASLLVDLVRLGIRLESDGSRLRFSPRSAVTPDLVDRLKAHKAELIAIFRNRTASVALPDASAAWHAALDLLEDNPLFPANVIAALRGAEVRWAADEPSTQGASLPIPDLF